MYGIDVKERRQDRYRYSFDFFLSRSGSLKWIRARRGEKDVEKILCSILLRGYAMNIYPHSRDKIAHTFSTQRRILKREPHTHHIELAK